MVLVFDLFDFLFVFLHIVEEATRGTREFAAHNANTAGGSQLNSANFDPGVAELLINATEAWHRLRSDHLEVSCNSPVFAVVQSGRKELFIDGQACKRSEEGLGTPLCASNLLSLSPLHNWAVLSNHFADLRVYVELGGGCGGVSGCENNRCESFHLMRNKFYCAGA